MSLAAGTKLGPYEVVGGIGAGGMGEVYRARDTKLGREVALKVLPEAFASDAERMARFEREAKVLASLNHPNIASIYGFEESGNVRALVMELVEGQTLAERIVGGVGAGLKPAPTDARGVSASEAGAKSTRAGSRQVGTGAPVTLGVIPIEEALPIARQICEGLEYAHDRGIVHRDLKPANVKVTPDGMVKILDFGLAKALEGEAVAGDPSRSPTLSRLATQAGIVLGTAAYMSPEQAKGKSVDRRTDIWAFGCVLYEMLTGKHAFDGETVTDVLAAVVRAEPDWSLLPANTPRTLRKLLERCLQKDAKQRLQAIGEARIAIEELLAGKAEPEPSVAPATPSEVPAAGRRRDGILWGVAGLLAGVAIAAAIWFSMRKPEMPPAPVDLSVEMPATHTLLNDGTSIAISPDGRQIAFVAGGAGGPEQIWVRQLDDFAARPVPDTEGGKSPLFSPDGQWLGFFVGGKLEKISLAGGVPQVLCTGASGVGSGTWAPDWTIYFSGGYGGLMSVSGYGGECRRVISPTESTGAVGFSQPWMLPGGQSLLVAVATGFGGQQSSVAVLSLKTLKLKTLLQDATNPAYVAPGYLIFGRAGALWAVPFDLGKLELTGPSTPLVNGIADNNGGTFVQFAVSESGMLVYAPGSEARPEREIVETDRSGNSQAVTPSPRAYEDLSLSPDGNHLAITIEGPLWNIWTYDLVKKTLARLTFENDNRDPFWTADGKNIAYTSLRNGRWGIYEKPADGSGQEHELFQSAVWSFVSSFSPDDSSMAMVQDNPVTGPDIFLLPLHAAGKPRVFLQTKATEWFAQYSPDGRWIAYESDESGKSEIYVQSSGATGGKWQISSGGGVRPVWSRNDPEIFYRNGNKLMAVPVRTSPSFSAGTPQALFQADYFNSGHDFDATPDGKRFFFIKSLTEASAPTELRVVLHWAHELAERMRPRQTQ
jgi:serine/threonine protein kinase/Tol biopolymer transport system component